jgi:hypothetical protein
LDRVLGSLTQCAIRRISYVRDCGEGGSDYCYRSILRPKPRGEKMPHYHNQTKGSENDWKLIRETASSQKFRVTTEKTKIEVDIHYTAEKIH